MNKKNWIAAGAALTALCLGLTGCGISPLIPAQEEAAAPIDAVDQFLSAVQSGDYSAASGFLMEGNRLLPVFAASEGESVPMLDGVYQKLLGQMGSFTYTLEEGQVPSEILVTLQSTDYGPSIDQAMNAAIQAQTTGGGDAFADIAGWLTTGLETGETGEAQEYRCIVRKNGGKYQMSHTGYIDIDLLNAISGGFYTYSDLTMTTCTGGEENLRYADYIAALGDEVIGYVQTVTEELDHTPTEEEMAQMRQDYFSGLENLDGVYFGVQSSGNTITASMGIDFNQASSTALANAGIVSGKYISNGMSNLSLATTVRGFEEAGMVCETLPQYGESADA